MQMKSLIVNVLPAIPQLMARSEENIMIYHYLRLFDCVRDTKTHSTVFREDTKYGRGAKYSEILICLF